MTIVFLSQKRPTELVVYIAMVYIVIISSNKPKSDVLRVKARDLAAVH